MIRLWRIASFMFVSGFRPEKYWFRRNIFVKNVKNWILTIQMKFLGLEFFCKRDRISGKCKQKWQTHEKRTLLLDHFTSKSNDRGNKHCAGLALLLSKGCFLEWRKHFLPWKTFLSSIFLPLPFRKVSDLLEENIINSERKRYSGGNLFSYAVCSKFTVITVFQRKKHCFKGKPKYCSLLKSRSKSIAF